MYTKVFIKDKLVSFDPHINWLKYISRINIAQSGNEKYQYPLKCTCKVLSNNFSLKNSTYIYFMSKDAVVVAL